MLIPHKRGANPRLFPRFASSASVPPRSLGNVKGRSPHFVPSLRSGRLAVALLGSRRPVGFRRVGGLGSGRPSPLRFVGLPCPLARRCSSSHSPTLATSQPTACPLSLGLPSPSVVRSRGVAGLFPRSALRPGAGRSVAFAPSPLVRPLGGLAVAPCRFSAVGGKALFWGFAPGRLFSFVPLRFVRRKGRFASAVGGFALASFLASRFYTIRRLSALRSPPLPTP